jgi:N6-adenosine-specific RNA methylase IME4
MLYDIIYTDPPWKQTKGNARKCRPNQGKDLDYSTLSLDEIFELQMSFFNNVNTKHNIFMWTIDKYLHESEIRMNKLGYNLHARFVWNKLNGVAPAFTVRFSHEYLLWFYKKGNILMPCEKFRGKYTTVLTEQATTHSTKPQIAYEMLENMFPDTNKIELFARNKRAGWDCWGNEV